MGPQRQQALTQLMRQLMAEHSKRSTQSPSDPIGKRRPNGQSIAEVVQPISHDHHPCNGGDRGGGHFPVTVSMSVAVMAVVQHLMSLLRTLLLDFLEPLELFLGIFC